MQSFIFSVAFSGSSDHRIVLNTVPIKSRSSSGLLGKHSNCSEVSPNERDLSIVLNTVARRSKMCAGPVCHSSNYSVVIPNCFAHSIVLNTVAIHSIEGLSYSVFFLVCLCACVLHMRMCVCCRLVESGPGLVLFEITSMHRFSGHGCSSSDHEAQNTFPAHWVHWKKQGKRFLVATKIRGVTLGPSI